MRHSVLVEGSENMKLNEPAKTEIRQNSWQKAKRAKLYSDLSRPLYAGRGLAKYEVE